MNKPTGHRSHLSGWKRMLRHLSKTNWQDHESQRLNRWLASYKSSLKHES